MSRTDVRLALRDSPVLARFLFTVRAAISSARRSPVPRPFPRSVIRSYCASRLSFHACGTAHPSFPRVAYPLRPPPNRPRRTVAHMTVVDDFRRLHEDFLLLPNAWDVVSAAALVREGFPAV